MTKPITPDQAAKLKDNSIPDFVIKAFNELLIKNYKKNGITYIKQNDVLSLIISKMPDKYDEESYDNKKQEVFENNWLDIEPIFIAAGWSVKYDKPAYNETGEASFHFAKKS